MIRKNVNEKIIFLPLFFESVSLPSLQAEKEEGKVMDSE
jgi:hypothetical protein